MEGDSDMFRIIPSGEIMENSDEGYHVRCGEFMFAEFLIYSDGWTVSMDGKDYNNYVIYNSATNVSNRIDLLIIWRSFWNDI